MKTWTWWAALVLLSTSLAACSDGDDPPEQEPLPGWDSGTDEDPALDDDDGGDSGIREICHNDVCQT